MSEARTTEIVRVIGDIGQVVLRPPSTPNARRLTVFADGVKGVGARPGRDISNYFRERGDFLNASYPRLGPFSIEKACADLASFCEPYDEIDLIGASWGGRVLYECGLRCMSRYPGKAVTLTVADSPFAGRDVNGRRGRLISYLPSGLRVPSALNRRLTVDNESLKPSKHMSDDDRYALARHRAGLEDLTIGALASRLRTLYGRPEPTEKGMSRFHRVNCLTTPNDPLINHNAPKLWGLWVNPDRFRHISVERALGHTAMFEYQQEWLAAFQKCFER